MCEAVNEGKELKDKDSALEIDENTLATQKEKDELIEEIFAEEGNMDYSKEFGSENSGSEENQESAEPKKLKKIAKSDNEKADEVKDEEPKAKKSTKKTEEATKEIGEEKPKRARKPKVAEKEE
jgi:hypothetical protein